MSWNVHLKRVKSRVRNYVFELGRNDYVTTSWSSSYVTFHSSGIWKIIFKLLFLDEENEKAESVFSFVMAEVVSLKSYAVIKRV